MHGTRIGTSRVVKNVEICRTYNPCLLVFLSYQGPLIYQSVNIARYYRE